jgi:hypothetical protein
MAGTLIALGCPKKISASSAAYPPALAAPPLRLPVSGLDLLLLLDYGLGLG